MEGQQEGREAHDDNPEATSVKALPVVTAASEDCHLSSGEHHPHHHHRHVDQDAAAAVAGGASSSEEQQQQQQHEEHQETLTRKKESTGAASTWVEDEKSWNVYQGLSVMERMEKLKAAVKAGVAQCTDGMTTETDKTEKSDDKSAATNVAAASSLSADSILTDTMKTLHATIPEEIRASLPWSALINLINTGLSRIHWSFLGDMLTPAERRMANQDISLLECQSALTEALHGVTHWLPDAALDHSATPTVDPTTLGPDLSISEHRARYPIDYPNSPVLRVLTRDFPRRPYTTQRDETSSSNSSSSNNNSDPHWGQRKLFMNELELLTLHSQPGDTVVYAGAAPGRHIAYLAEVNFPEVNFVLVDPAPFRIRETRQIKLIHGLMTDALAKEYGQKENVIFVSDIRRTYASEDLILEDMMDQQRWHDLMRPKVSMFKFRLPWRAGQTEYLDGEVYLQPYAKPRSTETRLIVTGHNRRQWDNREYEEQCFFFNTIVRPARHAHGVFGAALDEETWDHAAEVEIWRAYMLKMDEKKRGEQQKKDDNTEEANLVHHKEGESHNDREDEKEGKRRFRDLSREAQNREIAEMSVKLTQHLEGQQGKAWLARVDWKVIKGDERGQREGGRGRGRGGGYNNGRGRRGGGGGGGYYSGRDDRREWRPHQHQRREGSGKRRRWEDEGQDGDEGGNRGKKREKE